MALDFPSSPTIGQVYTSGGRSWTWDGTSWVNSTATSLSNVSGTLAVANGGTGTSNGSITGTTALTFTAGGTNQDINLVPSGTGSVTAAKVAITGGTITGITDLAVADGGTGASDAATARTNLGLGSISTQAASNVAITGGSITGTPISGSTGSFTTLAASTSITLTRSAADAVLKLSSSGGSGRDWNLTSKTSGAFTIGSDLAADVLSVTGAGLTVSGKHSVLGTSSGTTVSEFTSYDTLTTDLAIWKRSDAAVSYRLRYNATTGNMQFGSTTAHDVEIQRGGSTVATFTSTGLNSTAIGATTPSTGAFTTLSSTGDYTISSGSSSGVIKHGGTAGRLILDGDSGQAGAELILYGSTHATQAYKLFAAASVFTFQSTSGTNPMTYTPGTGLAVTGSLTATGSGGVGTASASWGWLVKAPTVSNLCGSFIANNGQHAVTVLTNRSGYNTIASDYFSGSTYLPLRLSGRGEYSDLVLNTDGSASFGNGLTVNGLLTAKRNSDTVLLLDRTGGDNGYIQITAGATGDSYGELSFQRTGANTGNWYYGGNATGSHIWRSGGYAGRMTLDSSGNLSVNGGVTTTGNVIVGGNGTVNPGSGFDAVGIGFNGTTGKAEFSADGAAAVDVNRKTNDGTTIAFRRSGTQVGRVDVTTTSTSYVTSSDQRLKTDLGTFDLRNVAAPLYALKLRKYRWNVWGETDRAAYGVFAQEAKETNPWMVAHDEENDSWGVNWTAELPNIIAAVQVQKSDIELALEEIASLKARLAALENTRE